jgi:lipopolysaccharide heptosyltransferase I
MNNFLIIRLSSLGDIIHALPAFSALRNHFPEANITWLVEEKGEEILNLVPGINKVVVTRAKRLKLYSSSFREEISRIKSQIAAKDLTAVDFQGLIKSGLFAWFSKAEKRIGFHRKNLREPLASIFYTQRLYKITEDIHVIYKNLKLLELLGIEDSKIDFPLQLSGKLLNSVRDKMKISGYSPEKRLVIINVGAAWESKRWFPEKWSRVIKKIDSDQIYPLLLWGNEVEKKIAREIAETTGVPLSPSLSLAEVIALVHEASLVVSGDTFALQAACALSRPVVGLFGPTTPGRNGPFKDSGKVVFQEFDCSHCYKRKCADLRCMKSIKPENVAELCKQALEQNE